MYAPSQKMICFSCENPTGHPPSPQPPRSITKRGTIEQLFSSTTNSSMSEQPVSQHHSPHPLIRRISLTELYRPFFSRSRDTP